MSASGAESGGVGDPGAAVGASELRTDRLVLRQWRETDREPFAAMNADPDVMEHFPGVMSRAESDALADRLEESIGTYGHGLWAVELVREAPFIGFVGVQWVSETMPFAPALEVGWRLARPYWGRSLAFEAARAALDFAFAQLGVGEVVAYTAARNARSRRLMERLGMRRDADGDFLHPGIDPSSPLQPHVVYRIACVSS